MTRQHFCARQLVGAAATLALWHGPLSAAERTIIVPAQRLWVDSGIQVPQGQALHLRAAGQARLVGRRWLGPEGTYVWPKYYKPRGLFALPTMAEGPAPAFCLIGRIGEDGAPFVIGRAFDGLAPRSGRLWLGLNDDYLPGNEGQFEVTVLDTAETAAAVDWPLVTPGTSGAPVPKARVLLLYVDGLRMDVVREMAAAGYLPNFQRVFLDGGLQVPEAFTVFPSNTLIANGALFTGRFPDATGIKSQNQFERSTLKARGQLSQWLPDGFIPQPPTRVFNLLDKYAPENTHSFLIKRGIPTLASRLGARFGFTTLPIAPLNPPTLWLHWAINTLSPFGLPARLPQHLDTVNARYTIRALIGNPDLRVMAVWLPMLDKTCHHSGRGQFGAARRDLALADESLGQILARLEEVRWRASTYLVLVSDHGHLGGETRVNRRCNLPRDWAHGQLGCNVRVVGQEWRHAGIAEDRFVFFDNQGAGQAKLFLPYQSYFKGPWQRNRLHELMAYDVRPGQQVNLLTSLTSFRPPEWQPGDPRPVDLILVKLDEQRTLVYRDETDQALLHREPGSDGLERYRYEPMQGIRQAEDGTLQYDLPLPAADPLGYLQEPSFLAATGGRAWLAQPRTADEWLEATRRTRYPDAVVAMTKFFAWREGLQDLRTLRDPDVLVTAAEGWSFRSDDGEGTDHGYPLAGSMRMALALHGPNIRRGIWPHPQRIIDVLPTILDMVGKPADPSTVDGRAMRGIYDDPS
jgi:hypothetical protein